MNGLRYIMQLEELTTAEVAKKMKVNRSLISVWQTGRRIIPNNRISELAGIFPKYPAYYFNKELTTEDMAAIREIKISGKAMETPRKDERMSKVESLIKEQIVEHGRVLSDVAEIMKLGDYTALLKSSDNISDKQMLTLLFSVVGASQKSYIHDYAILNQLEKLKRNAEKHGIEDFKLSLIGVAMSALAVAFGFDDDVSALAVPQNLRAILPAEAIEKDPNIKLFSEWRDRILAVFKDIIDYCDSKQRRIDKLNEELKER